MVTHNALQLVSLTSCIGVECVVFCKSIPKHSSLVTICLSCLHLQAPNSKVEGSRWVLRWERELCVTKVRAEGGTKVLFTIYHQCRDSLLNQSRRWTFDFLKSIKIIKCKISYPLSAHMMQITWTCLLILAVYV